MSDSLQTVNFQVSTNCKEIVKSCIGGLLDEAVTDSMDSDDVLRFRRVVLDFLTQPGDMIINRARDRSALVSPNFVEQLIAGDYFTAMPDQVVQDLKFASGEI